MKLKVKALINFNDLEGKTKRKVGDIFEVSKIRADYLIEHKAIEIVEEIKEAEIEEVQEETKEEKVEKKQANDNVKKNKKKSKKR